MSIDLFRQIVSVNDGEVVTTSRKIAEVFGKNHKDVLRAINQLECSDYFRERNFALSQYVQKMPTGGSKSVNEFLITKDGMAFLVMGFKGKEAAKFKEAYINAFNWMADKIHQRDELDRELNDFTRRESNSISAGSFHGRGLAQRRVEKNKLADELKDLQQRIQMVLPALEVN
ncbi:MAG: Rha family transcriptional regulator [Hafnia sp.]